MMTLLLAMAPGCDGDGGGGAADTSGGAASSDVLTADGDGAEGADVAVGEDVPPPFTLADLPTGRCGATPYEWVDPATLGTIVDWEPLPTLSFSASQVDGAAAGLGLGFVTPVPYDVEIYRVRHTTQDRGEIIETTALVGLPVVSEPTELQTFVWMHPTTGMEDFCAPSGRGLVWALPVIVTAALGYAVVAPDFIGQNGFGPEAIEKHPYLVGEPAAIGTLDSIRALWNLLGDGGALAGPVAASQDVVLAGGSEGGFVTLWADRFAGFYLPEANIVAVAAMAPLTDLVGMLESATEELTVGIVGITAGAIMARDWYGGTQSDAELLTEQAAADVLYLLDNECPSAKIPDGYETVDQIFAPDFLADVVSGAWRDSAWHCYLADSSLHLSDIPRSSDAPVLYVTGEVDDVALSHIQRDTLPGLCDDGYVIYHLECADADHYDVGSEGLAPALDWLFRLRDGEELGDACVVNTPVDCSALTADL